MKNKTRELFKKYGIPTVPKYDEIEKEDPELRREVREMHEIHFVNEIFILKNNLHMSDSDMKLYFTSKKFIDDDYVTRQNALKDYRVKERYYKRNNNGGFEDIDFGYTEDEYILYENNNHLILDHINYVTGCGTDHWTTIIK